MNTLYMTLIHERPEKEGSGHDDPLYDQRHITDYCWLALRQVAVSGLLSGKVEEPKLCMGDGIRAVEVKGIRKMYSVALWDLYGFRRGL